MLWQSFFRKLMFLLPPETAHYAAMGMFNLAAGLPTARLIQARFRVVDPRLQQQVAGLKFINPVGLAAGFDKDGRWFRQLSLLGFGHLEIGTLTGTAQPGNDRPRLFRLPADQAIINRMGFNNGGADSAAKKLAGLHAADPEKRDFRLGINIGKSKIVPLEEAATDYRFSFDRLFSFADYFTVNVSSPNTPGLRQLQNRQQLQELLISLIELNLQLAADHQVTPKPIFLKIAPDLTNDQLDDIVAIATYLKLPGVIATNTTIDRKNLKTDTTAVERMGAGGLSGQPLTLRSRQVVRHLYQQLPATTAVIGVGGIMTPEDAWQMILAGAQLIQLYTGFVYAGPPIVANINRYLLTQIEQHGLQHISQAIGMDN